jgi:hypothetical protein
VSSPAGDGISTLRDRVCMTAALLVLEPFPEQYARARASWGLTPN